MQEQGLGVVGEEGRRESVYNDKCGYRYSKTNTNVADMVYSCMQNT